ncbi:plasmid replication protein RepC [Falsirhodobacter algicola]|uniref:Replication initiation protein RepC n=1 Tax=Falsirhodobacter algicola TaxID=2692330 RepID=A0A8J8MW40_9RHOB|nr:plasmid replication protein RepC [Falsirhodobacter algicola]QUS37416.1 hypothetical protein GR316_13625 [Falsirhodobacter algicola]
MTFKKLMSRPPVGAIDAAVPKGNADETWIIFQTIRDAAPTLGLKPKVIQTLAAMISCLKPGRGTVCFASTRELMRRLAGVSERTIRRHVSDLVAIGILERRDSPNFKRYVSRGASPADTIAFGFDLKPMVESRDRWSHALNEHNRSMLERRHLITIVKDLISRLEGENVAPAALAEARLRVRRKLTADDLRDLRNSLNALTPVSAVRPAEDAATDKGKSALPCTEFKHVTKTMETDDPSEMSDTGGHNDRNHSKSKIEDKDKNSLNQHASPHRTELKSLLGKLAIACQDALDFAEKPPRTENDMIALGHMLAPMIGIKPALQEEARTSLGALPAAISVMLMVRIHGRVRNMEAYFRSLVSGRRRISFEPLTLLDRLAQRAGSPSVAQFAGE